MAQQKTQSTFRTTVCRSVRDMFRVTSGHSLYLLISRPFDNSPEYSETRSDELDIWKNAIAAKRLIDIEVFLIAPKNLWKPDVVYAQYEDSKSTGSTSGVYTTNGNIYKCIYNNGGVNSLVAPQGADCIKDITTSDGYVWKYIMTVTDDLFDYITDEYIPIRSLEVDRSNANKYGGDPRSLQYDVQFNAIDGAIHSVLLGGTNTAVFSATRTNSEVRSSINEDSTRIHVKDANGPTDGDDPTGYSLTMMSGSASGMTRTIIGYDGETGHKYYDIDSSFGIPLSVSDSLSVLPKTEIYGDGSGAVLVPEMSDDNTVNRIKVMDKGSGYKYASANIVPVGVDPDTVPTLDPQMSPSGGHGSDPEGEIGPNRLLITSFLRRDEKEFPVTNDYSHFSLVLDPRIGGTGPNNGKIAGSEVSKFTTATIRTKPDEFVANLGYEEGDILIGKESHTGGVISSIRSVSETVANISLKDVSGFYKESEDVIGITMGSSGVFSSAGKNASVMQFQEDRYLGTNTNNYRLTTILGVSRPTGLYANDIPNDVTITGASGSDCVAVYADTTSAGTTANIYVTGITGGTAGNEFGYTYGEMITFSGGITASINTIDPPGLQAGTGIILHGQGITHESITRNYEQSELIRFLLDFGDIEDN